MQKETTNEFELYSDGTVPEVGDVCRWTAENLNSIPAPHNKPGEWCRGPFKVTAIVKGFGGWSELVLFPRPKTMGNVESWPMGNVESWPVDAFLKDKFLTAVEKVKRDGQ